ncbi:peptidoglycan-binding protein [Luedemannella flava]|uniref:Peptidoglycan-binding protein n=1 Tax=Luedemannella flava TaxID=349316 RepID=A0ABN2LPP8_9ACTN
MRRRAWLVGGVVGVVAAAGTVAAVGFGRSGGQSPVAAPTPAATVEVTRGDLVDYVTLDASVGFGEARPLTVKATGTFTWLPAAGATVRRGQPVARVDEKPVVLLYGTVPAYRALTVGTRGTDVAQLERNLDALGYTGFAVDDMFSASTAEIVRSWQRDLGVPETGTVDATAVVYVAGAVRVAAQSVRVGAAAPADALSVTGTAKVVVATADAADAGWAEPGVAVTVVLPDGATVPGRVAAAGTGAAAPAAEGEAGAAGARIAVTVPDQKALAGATSGLTVRYAARTRSDVLSVPVSALLALAEGGYGLELVEGGATRIVAVRAGMFADGRVEVSGPGIAPGAVVRMPT